LNCVDFMFKKAFIELPVNEIAMLDHATGGGDYLYHGKNQVCTPVMGIPSLDLLQLVEF
jgi:hypothetical protein